ncbi:MAG: hypothetical protein AAF541_09065 [Pseudomonadota bacterium]
MSIEYLLPNCTLNQQLEVTQPYLALDQVHVTTDGQVAGSLQPEQPMYQEAGGIAASEVGRHLAILGSIALAQRNPKPGRHFYLATSAELVNLQPISDLSRMTLQATATACEFNGKTACSVCEIRTPELGVLYLLNTTYQVLSERLFCRMFAHHRFTEPVVMAGSPYAMVEGLDIERSDDSHCRSRVMTVEPAQCLGHFAEYPSLPVAILMGRLGRVAGHLFLHRRGSPEGRYHVMRGDMQAHQLAFAGERLRFSASIAEVIREGSERFHCTVENEDGVIFGELALTLAQVDSAS